MLKAKTHKAPKNLMEMEKPIPLFVSPSAWQTWGKCALSLQNLKTTLMPDDTDEYAKAGTNLHLLIADALRNGLHDVREYGDDGPLVRFAVETTLAEKGDQCTALVVERYMETKKTGVTISGTPDCLIPEGDTITIIDHKTGWKEVEAEGNHQLKIYAHLYVLKNKRIKKWRGVIINARFNSTSYTGGDIEPKYLTSVINDLKKRTAEGQHKTGNHCAYCQRLTICKMLRNEVVKWLAPGAIDSLTRDPERLAEALKLAKPAEKLFDTIKKEAQLYMDLGGIIPGVTVEYSAGTRAWSKDLTVEKIAHCILISPDKMIEQKLISPAEAERRGANKDAVNIITIRPPRKGLKFN